VEKGHRPLSVINKLWQRIPLMGGRRSCCSTKTRSDRLSKGFQIIYIISEHLFVYSGRSTSAIILSTKSRINHCSDGLVVPQILRPAASRVNTHTSSPTHGRECISIGLSIRTFVQVAESVTLSILCRSFRLQNKSIPLRYQPRI
jgi:hypothetical protein